MIYRVPWWMQVNRRGEWVRKHMHSRPQTPYNKIISILATQQGRWAMKGRKW